MYYERLTKNPTVRGDHESHLNFTNSINKEYLKDLQKHYKRELIVKEEGHEEYFKKQIDFLTGVYTKEAENEKKRELRESLKAIPNKHYQPS